MALVGIPASPPNTNDSDELYGRYRELYPATRDVMHMLARVGGEARDQQPQEV